MDWSGGAGDRIAPLIQEAGRARAQGMQARGQIWGQTLGTLGQLIAGAPDRQLREQEIQARTAELHDRQQARQLDVEDRQRQQQEEEALKQIAADPSMRNEDGSFNLERFAGAVAPHNPKLAESVAGLAARMAELKAQTAATQRKVNIEDNDLAAYIFGNAKTDDDIKGGFVAATGVLPEAKIQELQSIFDQHGVQGVQIVQQRSPAWHARQQKLADAPVTTAAPGSALLKNGVQVGAVPDRPPTPPAPRAPVPVTTVDAQGRRVTRFVLPTEGMELQQPEPAASGGGAEATDRQRLVAAIIANPAQYDKLTPSAQTAIFADLAEKGFTFPTGVSAAAANAGLKLTGTQGEDLATMMTVVDLINNAQTLGDKIKWKGVGGLGTGSASSAAANLGMGTAEEETLRNQIGNIQGTIAKLRGGTAFSAAEKAMLDSYTPGINDGDMKIKTKLASLKDFIALKQRNTLKVAAGDFSPNAPSPPTQNAAAPTAHKVGDRVTFNGKTYTVKAIANGQADLEAVP